MGKQANLVDPTNTPKTGMIISPYGMKVDNKEKKTTPPHFIFINNSAPNYQVTSINDYIQESESEKKFWIAWNFP